MSRTGPVGVGVAGAGNISAEYLANIVDFPDLDVRGIASLGGKSAREAAARHGISAFDSVEAMLDDPSVEVILNLTVPAAHFDVSLKGLMAGRHVWSEKPFALSAEEGSRLLAVAGGNGLMIGSAPDTFLGPTSQAIQRSIARGTIGLPVFARAAYESAGPESWHPNPAFLYDVGAGPLFDVGPYYLTELVQALGGVARVSGLGRRSADIRVVGSGGDAGKVFPVRVPTTTMALLAFRSGAVAQVTFSFDSIRAPGGSIEITGTGGTLSVADPEMFGRPVTLTRPDGSSELLEAESVRHKRGYGLLEMARSVRNGRQARTSAWLAQHVLVIMSAIEQSSTNGTVVEIEGDFEPASPLEAAWDPYAPTLRASSPVRPLWR